METSPHTLPQGGLGAYGRPRWSWPAMSRPWPCFQKPGFQINDVVQQVSPTHKTPLTEADGVFGLVHQRLADGCRQNLVVGIGEGQRASVSRSKDGWRSVACDLLLGEEDHETRIE